MRTLSFPFFAITLILLLSKSNSFSSMTVNFFICPEKFPDFSLCQIALSIEFPKECLPLLAELQSRPYKKIFSSVFSSRFTNFCSDNSSSVRVPVLSQQRTSMFPKSSIETRFLVITFSFDIFNAAFDNETVITMGRTSGVIPTATASANKNEIIMSCLRNAFTMKINTVIIATIFSRKLLNSVMLLWKPERVISVFSEEAVFPKKVFSPVAITIP